MENPKIENQPQETQGKTTNTINNQDQTQINTQSIDRRKAGVNAWRINPQITKPASTSTGAQAAETSE